VRAGSLPATEGGCHLDVEPLSDGVFLEQIEAGDEVLRQALLRWCSQDGRPPRALRSLQVLRDLAGLGGALNEVWDHRTLLYGRNMGGWPTVGQRQRWAWVLPEDLGDRGWRADLELWLACRVGDDSARAFSRVLVRSFEPVHLTTMAELWSDSEARLPDRDAVGLILEQALRAGAHPRGSIRRWLSPPGLLDHAYAEERRRIQAVLSGLVRGRDHSRCPALVSAYCDYLVERLPTEEGVALLGAVRSLGGATADRALRIVAADGDRFSDELRRMALMQLLTPIQSKVLAFDTDVQVRRTA